MVYKIFPIILGNNQKILFGSENDAILIYNIFYSFYLKNELWCIPKLYINKEVNLINILNKVKDIDINSLIIVYFSGHSSKHGKINFYNNFYSSEYILKKFNNLNNIKKNIYFIIDSCFSENFICTNKKFKNIESVTYIVSSKKTQTSKEILLKYDKNMFKIKKINSIKNDNIILGIFTFYFYKLLEQKQTFNLKDWKRLLIQDELWNIIKNKYNQQIIYIQNKKSKLN